MIYICKICSAHDQNDKLNGRNDNLNYYKFGLGLGVASATPSTSGKKVDGEATEAATGGADQ
jgi:hypothetical protein